MKKMILLTLTLITSIILSSCGNSDNPISSSDNSMLENTKWEYSEFDTIDIDVYQTIRKFHILYSFTENKLITNELTINGTDSTQQDTFFYKIVDIENQTFLLMKKNNNAKGGLSVEFIKNNDTTLTIMAPTYGGYFEKVNNYYTYQEIDNTGSIDEELKIKFITKDSAQIIKIKNNSQDTSYEKLDNEALKNLVINNSYFIINKNIYDIDHNFILHKIQ